MEASAPAPRVNFEMLKQHINKKVRLVGEITGVENNGMLAKVKAADGGLVGVELVKGQNFEGSFYEFEGTVQTPMQMRETSRASYGSSFNLQVYNELCKIAASTHSSLFL